MPGGRPLGSKSKNSQFLLKRMEDMVGEGFHPLMKQLQRHQMLDQLIDEEWERRESNPEKFDEARLRELIKEDSTVLDRVAPYVAAKLKTMEVTGEVLIPTVRTIDLTGGQITQDEQQQIEEITQVRVLDAISEEVIKDD